MIMANWLITAHVEHDVSMVTGRTQRVTTYVNLSMIFRGWDGENN